MSLIVERYPATAATPLRTAHIISTNKAIHFSYVIEDLRRIEILQTHR